jgi:hypothetical protein
VTRYDSFFHHLEKVCIHPNRQKEEHSLIGFSETHWRIQGVDRRSFSTTATCSFLSLSTLCTVDEEIEERTYLRKSQADESTRVKSSSTTERGPSSSFLFTRCEQALKTDKTIPDKLKADFVDSTIGKPMTFDDKNEYRSFTR